MTQESKTIYRQVQVLSLLNCDLSLQGSEQAGTSTCTYDKKLVPDQ